MIVVTIVTKWKIVTQEFVWLTSFDVLLENVFLFIGNVSIYILNRGIIKNFINHNHFLGDGEPDCEGNEDENPNECKNENVKKCDETYFKCGNHRCIPGRWRCDYDDDCGKLEFFSKLK